MFQLLEKNKMAIRITDAETGEVVDKDLAEYEPASFRGGVLVDYRPIEKKFTLEVPIDLLVLLKTLASKKANNNEFALVMKAKRHGMVFKINYNSIYLPKQTVSSGAVTIEDDLVFGNYNCIVHRHPTGVRSFSTTDDTNLNRFFEISFLYIPPFDLPKAIVNINLGKGNKIQVDCDCVVVGKTDEKFLSDWNERVTFAHSGRQNIGNLTIQNAPPTKGLQTHIGLHEEDKEEEYESHFIGFGNSKKRDTIGIENGYSSIKDFMNMKD